MDLERIANVTGLNIPNPEKHSAFNIQIGVLSSALEHARPDFIQDHMGSTPETVSAVKALAIAHAAGQRTYRITQANQAEVLPNIHHLPEVMADIHNALASGRIVITHPDPLTISNWSVSGYIIIDLETGNGA